MTPRQLGRLFALQKLGMDAASFAAMAQEDETKATEKVVAKSLDVEKTPSWSGSSSLESGDAGTRNQQLGLPRFSGV